MTSFNPPSPFNAPARETPVAIDFLLIPDFSNLTFAAMFEPLRAANRAARREIYRYRLLSPDGEAVRSSSGLLMPVDGKLDPDTSATAPSALFVVASYNQDKHATPAILAALRTIARQGVVLGGLETGAHMLAKAGLLDGYRATTHWEDLEEFSYHFPEVEVVSDRYVIDRDRITTGGAIPALDMTLELIGKQFGPNLALNTGSAFIYAQERPSSDPQYSIELGRMARTHPRLAKAIAAMEGALEEPLTIAQIAEAASLTQRSLHRLFQSQLNCAPSQYYADLRLAHARRLMELTDRPLADIAGACGYATPSAFSRAIKKRYGLSPQQLRR